ncbi:hypothetical protein A0H81_05637 [Grifola frondosa]|uniref:Uncharacterized protein n=1 Tax=Grifola frondosa TaxID=5627 RepID=A0A1C7MDE0_GRIFR|nr:hypothetical protein A0H81_05637 [Grifola frondosa]
MEIAGLYLSAEAMLTSRWKSVWPLLLQLSLPNALIDIARAGSISSVEGVYNSSNTPTYLPWNTYNYCNAPHVNHEHYSEPSNIAGAKLVPGCRRVLLACFMTKTPRTAFVDTNSTDVDHDYYVEALTRAHPGAAIVDIDNVRNGLLVVFHNITVMRLLLSLLARREA